MLPMRAPQLIRTTCMLVEQASAKPTGTPQFGLLSRALRKVVSDLHQDELSTGSRPIHAVHLFERRPTCSTVNLATQQNSQPADVVRMPYWKPRAIRPRAA